MINTNLAGADYMEGEGNSIPTSTIRKRRSEIESQLQPFADAEKVSAKIVVSNILKNSGEELGNYIISNGETPATTVQGKIIQAALIRMNQIATVARVRDSSEESALAHIEEAESEATDMNTAGADEVLKPETQAALKFVYENIAKQVHDKTGANSLGEVIESLKKVVATPVNGFTGTNFEAPDNFDWASVTDALSGATNSSDTAITAGSINAASAASSSGSDDSSSSVWDIIDNVAGALNSAAGAIRNLGGATGGAINTVGGAVNNQGSNIGAASIQKYIAANWGKILLFVIVTVLIIIIIVRAKRK